MVALSERARGAARARAVGVVVVLRGRRCRRDDAGDPAAAPGELHPPRRGPGDAEPGRLPWPRGRARARRPGHAVSTEALALAVVSIIRPTTAAAVWAMLVSSRPRRLLAVYLLAGMAVSLSVGIAVVLVAGGALSERSGFHFRAAVLVLLGSIALLGAVAVRLGWARRFRPDVPTAVHHQRRLSPAAAAATGVVTHLPGVFYIAALGAITGTGAAATGAVVQVVIYNIVWFAPAIVALGASLAGTIPSGDRLVGAAAWGRTHQDLILAICFAGVGVWLIVKGVADLG
jgi:hypothetical protein